MGAVIDVAGAASYGLRDPQVVIPRRAHELDHVVVVVPARVTVTVTVTVFMRTFMRMLDPRGRPVVVVPNRLMESDVQ